MATTIEDASEDINIFFFEFGEMEVNVPSVPYKFHLVKLGVL